MIVIRRDTRIGEILEMDEGISKVLLQHGMDCEGCPGSYHESLEEAADGHGVALDTLIADLNHYLKNLA